MKIFGGGKSNKLRYRWVISGKKMTGNEVVLLHL